MLVKGKKEIVKEFDSTTVKMKLPGTVTSANTADKFVLVYDRVSGRLLGSVLVDRTDGKWSVMIPHQADKTLTVICRDEGNDFNADIYDKVSLCAEQFTHGPELNNLIIGDETKLNEYEIVGTTKNISSIPSNIVEHNLKGDASYMSIETSGAVTIKSVSNVPIDMSSSDSYIKSGATINESSRIIDTNNFELTNRPNYVVTPDIFADGSDYLTLLNGENKDLSGNSSIISSSLETTKGLFGDAFSHAWAGGSYGSGDYLTPGVSMYSGEWSVSFWLYAYGWYYWTYDGNSFRQNGVLDLTTSLNGNIWVRSGNGVSWNTRRVVAMGSNFFTGNWNHITLSSGNGTMVLYINGAAVGTWADAGITAPIANVKNSDLIIGKGVRNYGIYQQFDLFRIFKKAVTAEEAAILYAEIPRANTPISTIYGHTLESKSLKLTNNDEKPSLDMKMKGDWKDSTGNYPTLVGATKIDKDGIAFDGANTIHKLNTSGDTSTGGDIGDESNIDVVFRFKPISISGNQVIWKSGGATNGLAVGLNNSGVGVFGMNSSSPTSIQIPNSIVAGSWYKVMCKNDEITLFNDSGPTHTRTKGELIAGNGTEQESIGGACVSSPMTGTASTSDFFSGEVSDVAIYEGGTAKVVSPGSLKVAAEIGGTGVECNVEIEKWDAYNNECTLWVEIPELTPGTDSLLKLYFDKDHSNNEKVSDTKVAPTIPANATQDWIDLRAASEADTTVAYSIPEGFGGGVIDQKSFKISLDSSAITEDQVNFPVSLNLTGTNVQHNKMFTELGAPETSAKSIIFDFANNYGGTLLGVRSIDFYLDNILITMVTGFSTYATNVYDQIYASDNAFNTSLLKTGPSSNRSFVANASTNQRLILVVDTPLKFNKIVINPHHSTGSSASTAHDAKDVVITISPDAITNTVYGSNVENGKVIFDGTFDRHPTSNTVYNQEIVIRNYSKKFSIKQGDVQCHVEIENWGKRYDQLVYSDPKPVHQWTMDNISGTTINDEIGSSNGTISNMVPESGGKFNKHLAGGSTTNITRNFELATAVPFKSVSMWIRRVSLTGHDWFARTQDVGDGAFGILPLSSGNKIYAHSGGNANTNLAIVDTEWHHIVIVEGTDENNHWFYLDGVKASSEILTNATGLIKMFGMSGVATGYQTPDLDNIQVYDYVLSDEQIASLYTSKSTFATLHTKVPTYSANTNPELVVSFDKTMDDNIKYVGDIYDKASELVPHTFSSQTNGSITVTSSGDYSTAYAGWKCFNGLSSYNESWVSNAGLPKALQIDFGSAVENVVGSYKIKAPDSSGFNETPTSWVFQGSDDASSWTDLHTVSSEPSWSGSEERTYAIGDTSKKYRYYRINVTATAQGSYCTIGELSLFEKTPSAQVWDDNFIAVYHMNQDPNGGANSILDSTSNGYHLSPVGVWGAGLSLDTPDGKGVRINSMADYLKHDNQGDLFTDATMELYFSPDSDSIFGNKSLMTIGNGNYNSLSLGSGDSYAFAGSTGSGWDVAITWTPTLTAGNWYYASTTTTTSLTSMYLDGAAYKSTPAGPAKMSNSELKIGAHYGSVAAYGSAGIVGEARFSKIARSADWNKLTYLSITNALATWSNVFTSADQVSIKTTIDSSKLEPNYESVTGALSVTLNRSGNVNRTWRNVFLNAGLGAASGDGISVTLGHPADWTLSEMWIGYRDGTTMNFVSGSQKQVFFNGLPGLTVSSDNVRSDVLDFDYDSSKDIIVSFHTTSSSAPYGTNANCSSMYKAGNLASADTFTGATSATYICGVSNIEIADTKITNFPLTIKLGDDPTHAKIFEDLTSVPINGEVGTNHKLKITDKNNLSLPIEIESWNLPKYDSFTKLLIHADKTDASNTFVDSSPSGHVVSVGGEAHSTTSTHAVGSSSMYFDGSNDYISVPDSTDWTFGSGDFTIDMWLKRGSTGHRTFPFGQVAASGSGNSVSMRMEIAATNTVSLYYQGNDHATGYSFTDISSFHHFAIVRSGSIIRMFVDGVSVWSSPIGGSLIDSSTTFSFGRMGEYNGFYFHGWIDEIRISKGVARWTNNFSVPTSEYGKLNASAILHTKVPSISTSTNTELILTHDATLATNPLIGVTGTDAAQAVWDDNFVAVYHMSDINVLDSTKNKLNGSAKNMNSSSISDGSIIFNGSNQYIDCGNNALLNPSTEATYESIVKFNTLKTTSVVARDDRSLGRAYNLGLSYTTRKLEISGATIISGGSSVTLTTGTEYSFSASGSSDDGWKIFLDGAQDGSTSWISPVPTTGPTTIGRRSHASYPDYLDGSVSEVRISNIKRSNAWIVATNNSLKNNLLTYETVKDSTGEKDVFLSGWGNALIVSATVSGSSIKSAMTGFKLPLKLSLSAGTTSYNFATWFYNMMLNSTFSGTEIANHKLGSLREGFDGLKSDGAKFGKNMALIDNSSMKFDGAGSGIITMSDKVRPLVAKSTLTLSWWMKPTGRPSVTRGIMGTHHSGEITVSILSTGAIAIYSGYSTRFYQKIQTPANSINGDEWTHVTYVRDYPNRTNHIYIDGKLVTTAVMTRHIATSTYDMQIGVNAYHTTKYIGELSNISAFPKVFSASDVEKLYKNCEFNSYIGKYVVTIFESTNTEFQFLKGGSVNTITIDGSFPTNTLSSVAFTNDGKTYKIYKGSSWKSIASMDEAVHGNAGDSDWHYLNSSSVWTKHTNGKNFALAEAFETNQMTVESVGNLTSIQYASIFNASTGIFDMAVGMKSKSAGSTPEVTRIKFNEKEYWGSEIYDLTKYNGAFTLSKISWTYDSRYPNFKVFAMKTGDVAWSECTNGGVVPGIIPTLVTTGIKVQFKVEFDIIADINYEDFGLNFQIK